MIVLHHPLYVQGKSFSRILFVDVMLLLLLTMIFCSDNTYQIKQALKDIKSQSSQFHCTSGFSNSPARPKNRAHQR